MAAPIGNRYGIGDHNTGRPLKYATPEEFKAEAEKYIETTRQPNGAYKPTLTGLCYHLGFESLQSFYDYAKREEFSYTIRRLQLFVQSCYEQQLYSFAWAGASFALRNLGKEDWQDEVTQNQNTTVTQVTIEEKTRDADSN